MKQSANATKCLLFWLGLVTQIVWAESGGGMESKVQVTLSIETQRIDGQNRVRAKLVFFNSANQPARIARFLIVNGDEPSNHFFQIIHNGKMLEYKGMMKKRAPPGSDDFVMVSPQKRVESTFELSQVYDFSDSNSPYQITFEATDSGHPDRELKSNQVEFRLSVK